MQPIDFYFDFSSPYGYFASTRINQLAARYDREVRWHPLLLGVVFKTTGAAPLPSVPLKGHYSLRDFERTARFHGIPYRRPAHFPIASQGAARAMLAVEQAYDHQAAVQFAQAVYRAYFVEDLDLREHEVLQNLLRAQGRDAEKILADSDGGPIRDRLKSEIEAAMARGVFGSPFVIVDDEPFWGFDRFDQLQAFLRQAGGIEPQS